MNLNKFLSERQIPFEQFHHRPAYTAKEVANLDWLSGGRFDFGIGVGWQREEFEALAVPFEDRGRRNDEYIELMRRLWTDAESSFEGEFWSLPASRIALSRQVGVAAGCVASEPSSHSSLALAGSFTGVLHTGSVPPSSSSTIQGPANGTRLAIDAPMPRPQ